MMFYCTVITTTTAAVATTTPITITAATFIALVLRYLKGINRWFSYPKIPSHSRDQCECEWGCNETTPIGSNVFWTSSLQNLAQVSRQIP